MLLCGEETWSIYREQNPDFHRQLSATNSRDPLARNSEAVTDKMAQQIVLKCVDFLIYVSFFSLPVFLYASIYKYYIQI
jgi:hypothetical protein